jgi:hypothetical protein
MSKKDKYQEVTLKSIFRLVIFLLLAWVIISFLSQQSQLKQNINDPTISLEEALNNNVLGEMYSKLPPDSRNQIENFNQTEVGKYFDNSLKYVQEKLNGFPQKQIKEIKKAIIKNISDDMIKNIEGN